MKRLPPWQVTWGSASNEIPQLKRWRYRDNKYFEWDILALTWRQISDPCLIQALEAELNNILWEAYEAE